MKKREPQKSLTVEEYEKKIPDCCVLRTAKEHCEILLWCWSLLGDEDVTECGRECEFHKEHDPELLERIMREAQQK